MRKISWACDVVTEMLPIPKKTIFDLIIRGQILDITVQKISLDFVRGQAVAETSAVRVGRV